MNRLWAPWRMAYLRGDETAADHCIFCAEGRDSPWVVHCEEKAVVVGNRFPYANGHVMVAPSRHIDRYEALTDEEILVIGRLTAQCIRVLRRMYDPDGFNIGWNIGAAAGAGIAGHLHQHIVPRWNGDNNFMPVLADVRVIPEHLEETIRRFKTLFEELTCEP